MSFGGITDERGLDVYYKQVFSFKSGVKSFLFQQFNSGGAANNAARISSISFHGKIEEVVSKASWDKYFFAMIPMNIEDHVYCYGQCEEDKSWMIRDLTGGQLGPVTAEGTWQTNYDVMRSFNLKGETFIVYHNDRDATQKDFFIQKVLPGGILGETTASQKWQNYFPTMIPVEFDGRAFIFAQTRNNNYWFIQEVLKGGTLGPYVDGTWDTFYEDAVGFTLEGMQFLYLSSKSAKPYPGVIREVTPEGKLGETTDTEEEIRFRTHMAALNVEHRPFLYAQLPDQLSYMIKDFLPRRS